MRMRISISKQRLYDDNLNIKIYEPKNSNTELKVQKGVHLKTVTAINFMMKYKCKPGLFGCEKKPLRDYYVTRLA